MTSEFGSPEEYIDLADALYKDGQTAKSLAVLTEASQRNWPPVQRGILLNQLAYFHCNVTGNRDEALALACNAISVLSPHPPSLAGHLALIEAESLVAHSSWESDRPRASEAASDALDRIEHLIGAVQGDQNTLWQLYYAASRLLALSDQWEKAIESAQRAVALAVEQDQKIIPLFELGCILRVAGRNHEARRELKRALRWLTIHDPTNARIHHELALVERALGNWAEARTHIEKAIEIAQSDAYMRADLQYGKALHSELLTMLRELGEPGDNPRVSA